MNTAAWAEKAPTEDTKQALRRAARRYLEAVREDSFRAKARAGAGWWGSLQDGWAEEAFRFAERNVSILKGSGPTSREATSRSRARGRHQAPASRPESPRRDGKQPA